MPLRLQALHPLLQAQILKAVLHSLAISPLVGRQCRGSPHQRLVRCNKQPHNLLHKQQHRFALCMLYKCRMSLGIIFIQPVSGCITSCS